MLNEVRQRIPPSTQKDSDLELLIALILCGIEVKVILLVQSSNKFLESALVDPVPKSRIQKSTGH